MHFYENHVGYGTAGIRAAKRVFGSQGKSKFAPPPPPPILQIMMLKLSPPRCVISKESVQQK
jgi:hypothetical protein